jgi:hypothetical protein
LCGELWLSIVPSSSDGASSKTATNARISAGRPDAKS